MKKIIIYAYTHFNLGDDLFIKVLCERYPQTSFFVHAPKKYNDSFRDLSNLQIISNDSWINRGLRYISRKLKLRQFLKHFSHQQYDAVILIGGSIFIQADNWQEIFRETKSLSIPDKPFFLLGANFGPFHDKAYYTAHKKLFKNYTDICFRDNYSYELFNDLQHVRMANDIVFQLKKNAVNAYEKSIVISVIKPSVRQHLANKDTIYFKKIKEIAVYFMENGYAVTLLSFCAFEEDHHAINSIEKLIPNLYADKLTSHFYRANIEETLQIIAQTDFVIATRFHAMILGWIYEKPVFPIAYSEKMKHVMHDIGFSGISTDFDRLENVEPAHIFSSMKTNHIDISLQIKDSEKHFEKLDVYLQSRKEMEESWQRERSY